MVNASLRRVSIKNFKSLHDCEIEIKALNVVVGANASGKSNLVEVFRLLKKIYVDKDINPFSEWWGYDNVVWGKNEELPVTIGLDFDIEGYDVYFETTFTGIGGSFRILREVLDLRGYVKFEKRGKLLMVNHDLKFLYSVISNLREYDVSYGDKAKLKAKLKKEKNKLIKEKTYNIKSEQRLFTFLEQIWGGYVITEKKSKNNFMLNFIKIPRGVFQKEKEFEEIPVLCPAIEEEEEFEYLDEEFTYPTALSGIATQEILSTISKLMILYPLNIRAMKKPQPFKREDKLKEDGSNIANVFHSIYLKEGKIPEDIYNPLSIVFPNTEVRPYVTEDGRVFIRVYEDGIEFNPPNVSDGLYKILTILTAIHLKPPLLIVDELENSLHPETLELVLDTIKTSEVRTIITTHSPIMVDMTEPDDIILIEKEQGESKFRRPEDPEKIRKFLNEKQITFSEGWIYGDLFKTEQKT